MFGGAYFGQVMFAGLASGAAPASPLIPAKLLGWMTSYPTIPVADY